MPSIIDQIASELNISGASVSRALNNRPGVSEALRERIRQRARELNYTPSITARGLATSQTFGIGFFVSEKPGLTTQSDPYYGKILRGIEQVCADTDYHVSIATLTQAVFEAPESFRFVKERRIDGMILAGPDIPVAFVQQMLASGIPLVLVDNPVADLPVISVNSEDEVGGYIAVRHLLELGHRHIGVISGPTHWTSNAQRVQGYQRALDEAGLPVHVFHAERTTTASGAEACAAILQQHPELTALFAVNDSMAIGAIRAAAEAGRNVPADLSVVGFDDIEWATLNTPSLTTIRVPKDQIGQQAVNHLLSMLNGVTPESRVANLPVELIVRDSTGRPPQKP